MIRILVADDHALVRAGLVELLKKLRDIEVVGQASGGHEALRLAHTLSPNIALLDIAMPDLNGIETAARIATECPKVRVILLSMFDSEAHLKKALEAKICGYLLKGAELEELSRAIHTVYKGEVYLMPAVAKHLAGALTDRPRSTTDKIEQLSPRQRQVLQLVAEGYSSKEIAFRLGLSTKTVDAHRAQVMAKLSIYDIAGLVRFAMRTGLIQDLTSDSSIHPT